MKSCLKSLLFLALAGVSTGAYAGTVSYSCNGNIGLATCADFNSTVSGLYGSTFTNANASIYIEYVSTPGLGTSIQSRILLAIPLITMR